MTAPEFDRQLLLSAALDGALSDAEQTIFDHELEADPTFAQEWLELQNLRSELKLSLRPIRQQKAAPDLAARIVASAFEVGRTQPADLGATPGIHPSSSRATNNPVAPVRPVVSENGRRVWSARIAGALALAASLMLMVTWLTNFDSENVPPQQIADSNLSGRIPATDINSVPDESSTSLAASDKPVPNDGDSKTGDALPVAADVAMTPQPASANVGPSRMADVPANIKPDRAPALMAENVADNEAPSSLRSQLQILLVFSVQVTDKGREQLALQNALRSSGIRLGSDTVVSDSVVSQLRQSNVITTSEAPSQSAKLFFIEGSAKKIDQLINTMLDQPEMFESVTMSLATDPPLLASVSELPVQDPTKIKSTAAEGLAISMTSSDNRPLAVSDGFPFMAVDRSLMQMGVGTANSQSTQDKDDFASQLLLIVR